MTFAQQMNARRMAREAAREEAMARQIRFTAVLACITGVTFYAFCAFLLA